MKDASETALNDACLLVGRFLYHFALVEGQLDRALAKFFELNADSSLVITANIDFSRKVQIVKTIAIMQMAGMKEPRKLDEKSVLATFNKILAVNNDRQIVAHSAFDANGDGVVFSRVVAKGELKKSAPQWSRAVFHSKFDDMKELEAALRQIVLDIAPYTPSLDFSDPRNSMYTTLLF